MSNRAAIIGCGMIAGLYEDFNAPYTYSHAKAYLKHDAFGKLAFCSNELEGAVSLAEKAGGEVYGSVESILASFHPDVVSVCIPDNFHYQVIKLLMLSPYAPSVIFAEKPVCTSRTELADLSKLQNISRSKIIVNHSRRFDTAHQKIKNLLARGDLGAPLRIHVDYYGGWRHLGVHIVDTLQYFFDSDLELERLEYFCESKYGDDPTLNVKGRIASATVTLMGHLEAYYQILDMNILCERGQVKLSDFGKNIEVLRKTVNAEKENVLEVDPSYSGPGMLSPICNAVDLIARYLSCGDHGLLMPYGLNEASRTMNTIWTGMEIYAAQS